MLILLSPAKTLDMTPNPQREDCTMPRTEEEIKALISELKTYSPEKLQKLMHVSEKIAQLNATRYQDFVLPFSSSNSKVAIDCFKGDVYTGLQAEDFSEKDREYAQCCMRILSGLYGVLRPLDLMQAYRLEMGTSLSTKKGKNLYEFWGKKITDLLNRDIEEHHHKQVINLASKEYFSSVNFNQISVPVITPVFKEKKGDSYKVIGLFAKKARGMMARYIIKHRIGDNVHKLQAFNESGYRYFPSMSSEKEWVFARAQ